MNTWELLVLAVGLAMDAFAVSICKGLSIGKTEKKHMCIAGLWFGGFQGLMPLLGHLLGRFFTSYVTKYAHWIAFMLLLIIGIGMVREAFEEGEKVDDQMNLRTMFLLAVATSIDALAVGVSFAFLKVAIVEAVLIIGVVTFIWSAAGIKIGSIFGMKYRAKSQMAGGIVLILIGLKILIEGML